MTGHLVVDARSITKTYRRGSERVRALDDTSFRLHRGEVVALIGPSGSGKSTMLNLLAGWEEPDGGEFVWSRDAREPSGWDDLAIVPQKLGLIAELTVVENVALPLRLTTGPDHPDVQSLLDRLGLDRFADRLPHEISVGEQQRTALARALVQSPELLLLDEPTGHQDAAWVEVVFEMLRDAAHNGACSLVATHNHEVLPFTDRILEIRDGVIVEASPAEERAEARAEGRAVEAPEPVPHEVEAAPSHDRWKRPT